jgi:Uncharacterised nucleotidyltransferase
MPAGVPRTLSSAAGIRAETELLFLLARTRFPPEAAGRIAVLLDQELDWLQFARNALSHDVLPLVYANLKATWGRAVPASILGQLARYFDQHARYNRRLAAELVRLLALFDAHSIPALALRGPELAAAAYGDLALRTFGDLDILIRRSDALRARDILFGDGYTLYETPLDAGGFPVEPGKYQYMFVREGGDWFTELHWRLTPQHLLAALDFEHLGGRRSMVTLNGSPVPTLTAEDTLLVLSIHGYTHHWGRLKWVCDVAELVSAAPHMNWRRVETDARRLGCWRMVALGLRLASDLLDASLPEGTSSVVRRDRRVAWLTAMVQDRLLRESSANRLSELYRSFGPYRDGRIAVLGALGAISSNPPGSAADESTPPYHPFQFLERSRDWIWNGIRFARLLLTVNARDRALLPALPRPLYAAYYPVRCVRLLAAYGLTPLVRNVRMATRTRSN